MSIPSLSPLLRFSLDSFEEAVEQYMKGTEKSKRFVVLHCDHAVELILKEKLLSLGDSIFVKAGSGRTIEFHDALNKLINNKGILIPEFPYLEMIHDTRNIIQHGGASVSQQQAESYIKIVYEFMKRFFKEELNLNLKKFLDDRYHRIFETTQMLVGDLIHLGHEYKVVHRNPIWIIEAYTQIIHDLMALAKPFIPHAEPITPEMVITSQLRRGNISEEDVTKFKSLTNLRNKYAHSTEKYLTIDADVDDYLNFAATFSEKLKKIRRDDLQTYS